MRRLKIFRLKASSKMNFGPSRVGRVTPCAPFCASQTAARTECDALPATAILLRAPNRYHGLALAVLALTLNTGCISTEKIEYRETDRVKVEFENDKAGKDFYEAYAKIQQGYDRSETKTEINLPILFTHKSRVVEGENAAFNKAVRRCDTNGDGMISEQEARIFADSVLGPR